MSFEVDECASRVDVPSGDGTRRPQSNRRKIAIAIALPFGIICGVAVILFLAFSWKSARIAVGTTTTTTTSSVGILSLEDFLKSLNAASFKNLSAVMESPWYLYLQHVYSDSQLINWMQKGELSLKSFWIIQLPLLPPELSLRDHVPLNPVGLHTLFSSLDSHVGSEQGAIYIYQYNAIPRRNPRYPDNRGDIDKNFKMLRGFPSDTWLEVERGPDAPGGYIWFYLMTGTGNWLNIGRTIVFHDHQAAFDAYHINQGDGPETQKRLGDILRAQGYKTIQFTCRSENVFKFEIFDLSYRQPATRSPCVPGIRTRGDQPCECSATMPYLNCKVGDSWLPKVTIESSETVSQSKGHFTT